MHSFEQELVPRELAGHCVVLIVQLSISQQQHVTIHNPLWKVKETSQLPVTTVGHLVYVQLPKILHRFPSPTLPYYRLQNQTRSPQITQNYVGRAQRLSLRGPPFRYPPQTAPPSSSPTLQYFWSTQYPRWDVSGPGPPESLTRVDSTYYSPTPPPCIGDFGRLVLLLFSSQFIYRTRK